MDDTERILQAISDLDNKFSDKLTELEEAISATNRRQTGHSQAIVKLQNSQQTQAHDIDDIKRTLAELAKDGSGALIKRDGRKAILKKEPVYSTFENTGINSRILMRILDEAGLVCSTPRNRTTVVWSKEKQSAFRAISQNDRQTRHVCHRRAA